MTRVTFQEKYYPAVKETLYQAKLENGLTVSLLPKNDFNEVYGVVTVYVGSVDTEFTARDRKKKTYPKGIAHFLEHKLFERENSEDIMAAFTKLGADSNAFTSFTNTSYLFSTSENVAECLDLLDELVTSFNITEESVEREKDIIQQEREMYQDDPDSCLFFKTLANLYPETPLASDIVGTEDSIEDISLENLRDNFDEFYTPVNSQIFLVGNFDLELMQNYFSQKDVGGCIVQNPKEPIALNPVKKVESIRMDVASPKLAIGVRTNSDMGHQDCYRYSVLLRALFTMMFGWTSKRFQSLYETGKLDSSLSLEVEINRRFNFLMLTMDTKEPVSISHQFRKTIQNFVTDADISEEHLDLIKSEIYGEFIHSMNSLEFIATQYQSHSDETTLFDLPKIIQEMTLDDVLEVGHHFIDNSEIVEFTIFPL
ncbi:EF-P 5-aminopentanol modification-associated protein YfmH [Streptococcus sp. CL9.43]|uniref:EF-P 5-aminopentanol modification-associated protein YfmH n=1 Tax=Streptococcus sp. CL9.43 TaxID=3392238 RepID=UPI003C7CDF5F